MLWLVNVTPYISRRTNWRPPLNSEIILRSKKGKNGQNNEFLVSAFKYFGNMVFQWTKDITQIVERYLVTSLKTVFALSFCLSWLPERVITNKMLLSCIYFVAWPAKSDDFAILLIEETADELSLTKKIVIKMWLVTAKQCYGCNQSYLRKTLLVVQWFLKPKIW